VNWCELYHEAAELVSLFEDHPDPETGYRYAGLVGSRLEALANNLSITHLWKGAAEDAAAVIR
jgi:hypothetical protein